jgi:ribonucleoside-diphosphate reductase alpha chain
MTGEAPISTLDLNTCSGYGSSMTAQSLAGLTANSLEVLRRRYLIHEDGRDEGRDGQGPVMESPDDMLRRVARAIAQPSASYGATSRQVDEIEERFYRRMATLEFLPNSPTLMNAGRALGQLAACFVVPVGDSTAAIFDAVGWAAEIQKTGGGTGFDFSRLRPSGDRVESTGGLASGPVLFMQVFDVATEAVKQGGTRRGANMGILRVDHPDILEFIGVKLDPTRMRNFNLSVAITDEFMQALHAGASYALVNPRTGDEVRRLDAGRVWGALVNAAWTTGDPGLVFLDTINRDNPTPALGSINSTNPCGEQPLLPFESCTLGSINLSKFAAGDGVDWERLREATRDAVDFLDNVIDANRYPLSAIAEATRATRKIGLGVMGFADLLIELGIPYGDARSLELGGRIADAIERESALRSQELAAERGAFPAWRGSTWAARGVAMRNATTTTVAPTGTISIIAGCSSGIEPLYAVAYERNVLDGQILREVHPAFRRLAEEGGYWSDALLEQLLERGTVTGLESVPPEVQSVFRTAHEIAPRVHVEMQAAFQRHTHAAVSKTINLPHDAPVAEVAAAYELAYELGCKGVTVYRDGSRSAQVLSFGDQRTAAAAPATDACPECGAAVARQARCAVCTHCGWSVCG